MGIYVFTARFLFEQLCLDATRPGSAHDFGHDIIPVDHPHASRVRIPVPRRKPQAATPIGATWARSTPISKPTWTWWRSIRCLNMYDEHWPIRTYMPNYPPPKFVFAEDGARRPPRRGARQHRLHRLDRLRRPGRALDPGPERAHQQLRARRRFDPASKGSTSAARPGFAARSSTRGCRFRRAPRSATTTNTIGPAASPSARAASS